jgi:hypothetical protein
MIQHVIRSGTTCPGRFLAGFFFCIVLEVFASGCDLTLIGLDLVSRMFGDFKHRLILYGLKILDLIITGQNWLYLYVCVVPFLKDGPPF